MHDSILMSPPIRSFVLLFGLNAVVAGNVYSQPKFNVFGRTASSWGTTAQTSDFSAKYRGEPEFRFETASSEFGPSGDNYANAKSRYDLNLLGGSFGVGAEFSGSLGPSPEMQATARSFAQTTYQIPNLGNHLLNLTKIQAIIPIHGRIGLFDGESGFDGFLAADVQWSYSLSNQDYSEQLFAGDGLLRFESTWSGSPELVERRGLFASTSNLDLTAFDDEPNRLLGHDILQGYEVSGFAIATVPIDELFDASYFHANFQLSTTLVAPQNSYAFVYGKSDFFNSAAFELRGLDKNDNVIEGLVFEPVFTVPEPSSLLGIGFLALVACNARRRR